MMEEKLEQEWGISLLRYQYDAEQLRENKSKNQGKVPLTEELLSSLELLAEAHRFVESSLVGEKQDVETLEYSRWKEKPEMDLHGLKLEDSSDEFRIDN